MRAKFLKEVLRGAIQLGDKKETIDTLNALTYSSGEIVDVLTARFYRGRSARAGRVYCSVWIRTKAGAHHNGHGYADGYGYEKKSEAFARAVEAGGVKLSEGVGGVGMSAVSKAAAAIVKACGYGGVVKIVQQ